MFKDDIWKDVWDVHAEPPMYFEMIFWNDEKRTYTYVFLGSFVVQLKKVFYKKIIKFPSEHL